MDLLKNPFHILGATTRDNKLRIMDLTEECNLLSDADECVDAQSKLTRPQNRISPEIAWLPGVNPEHIEAVLKQLDPPHQNLLNISDLPPLARANVLAAGLSRLTNITSANIVEWILAISHAYERIDAEKVRGTLNEERNISEFPQITDLSVITAEIQNQRDYYIKTLSSVINKLSVTERARILTLTLETVIGNNNNRCPILIDDLIQAYKKQVENDLEKKQKIIEALNEKIRALSDNKITDSELEKIVNQLINAVKEWDIIAQPIQLSKRSRGERHTDSFEIAWSVQKLSVYLFNEYNKYNLSEQLLTLLLDVFAEVPGIVDQIKNDKKELELLIHEEKSIEKFKVVEMQVNKLKEAADMKKPDSILTPMVNQLIQTVKTWETSKHKIEVNCAVAIVVRNNALHLWNEHQKLDFAIKLTNSLIGQFSGVNGMVEVNSKLNEDRRTLTGISEQQRRLLEESWQKTQKSLDFEEIKGYGCLIFILIGILVSIFQNC